MKFKERKGITLIALVITIVILIILAGITIIQLTGEEGILVKAKQAKIEIRKAQYYEEINIEAMAEKTEWVQSEKEGTTFIECLGVRVVTNRYEWATEYDIDGNELFIKTKEGYEIGINVDNEKLVASINEEDFSSDGGRCKITFVANTGEGTMADQIIKKDANATINANIFTKEGRIFKHWNTQADGNGTSYSDKGTIKISNNITLYAIWGDGTAPVLNLTGSAVGSVTFTATDPESGISGFAITDTNEQPETFTSWNGGSTTQNVTNNTNHYLWVKNGENIVSESQRFKIHQHSGTSSSRGGCYQQVIYHSHSDECRGPHYVVSSGVKRGSNNQCGDIYYGYCTICQKRIYSMAISGCWGPRWGRTL